MLAKWSQAELVSVLPRFFIIYIYILYAISPLMLIETLFSPQLEVKKFRHREVKQVCSVTQRARSKVETDLKF